MHLTAEDRLAASELLGFAKTGVRNGSIAITETATPYVRDVLLKQLQLGVHTHAAIFNYMLANGLYPAYNVEQIIQGDFMNAQMALSMPIEAPGAMMK